VTRGLSPVRRARATARVGRSAGCIRILIGRHRPNGLRGGFVAHSDQRGGQTAIPIHSFDCHCITGFLSLPAIVMDSTLHQFDRAGQRTAITTTAPDNANPVGMSGRPCCPARTRGKPNINLEDHPLPVFTLLGQVDQWALDLCEAQGTQPPKRRQRNPKRIFGRMKRLHSCTFLLGFNGTISTRVCSPSRWRRSLARRCSRAEYAGRGLAGSALRSQARLHRRVAKTSRAPASDASASSCTGR
jgi:hypothetical protein